ncbi:MAG: AEC family transporter [Salaquimonas sp.]
MLSIFLTILPVFVLMGIGWLAVKSEYLGDNLADTLNAFTVRLAVPVLLFRAMVNLDFSQAFNIPTLIGFYAGAVFSFIAGIFLARLIWKRRPGEAVAVGFCALFSNTVLLGIPIMQRSYGEEALTPVFGIIALHAGSMYTIGLISMELARADGRPLFETLRIAAKSILSNSLMIGVLSGIAINLSGIPLPEVIMSPVNMLASAALPVALVGIGAALTRYQIKAEFSEALMVSSLSLILHPLIAFIITHMIFGLPIELVRAAVIIGAMPPGMNVYIFAAMYDRAVSLSASAIVIATALSIFTISAWLWLLEHVVFS